jgi:hypothetical protein
MQVVLLVNLPLDLALHSQANDIRVALACNSRRIRVDYRQRLFECRHALPCCLLLLLDIVLEVARQRLDFLNLLRQISSQAAELVDDVGLNIAGLIGFDNGLLVEVAQDAVGVVEAALGHERSGRIGVVDDVGDLEQALCAVLVGGRDLAEVGDEVFEELAPSCLVLVACLPHCHMEVPTLEAVGQDLGGRALGRHGRVKDALVALIAMLLVVDGHAAYAARVHASPAAAALDGALLLEGATARGRGPLVQCGGAAGGA